MYGLWEKESNKKDACYIDFSQFHGLRFNYFEPEILQLIYQLSKNKSHKNDTFATELRSQGNRRFREHFWRSAMELYNKSLCCASVGSSNIGLAYGNRSACFFYMKLYERCLVDIELAKEANYPQRLMRKLDDRKAACLEQMRKSTQMETTSVPVLSFGAGEEIPCFANVLELRNNHEFGKHIVAKKDIEVGKTIILEDMFTFGAASKDQTFCITCLKAIQNFIPCPNCTSAFCDTHCLESNVIHKIDCGSSYHLELRADDISIVKSILIAVNAFPTVDDLMKFVESHLATRDFKTLIGLSGAQLKYGQFLKLLPVFRPVFIHLYHGQYLAAHKNLLQIQLIQQRFDSKRKQRFLMHLIVHHALIINSNTYSTRTSTNGVVNTVSNMTALLNHSCTPNVLVTFAGNQQISITIRPVKKGEQLFTQYKNVDKCELPFECKCTKCIPCYKLEDCERMKSDPNFWFIVRSDHTYFLDNTKFLTLKSKCREFLAKYGHLPWTKEIEIVSERFENCLDYSYNTC